MYIIPPLGLGSGPTSASCLLVFLKGKVLLGEWNVWRPPMLLLFLEHKSYPSQTDNSNYKLYCYEKYFVVIQII